MIVAIPSESVRCFSHPSEPGYNKDCGVFCQGKFARCGLKWRIVRRQRCENVSFREPICNLGATGKSVVREKGGHMRLTAFVGLIMLLGCTHSSYPISVDGLKAQGYQSSAAMFTSD